MTVDYANSRVLQAHYDCQPKACFENCRRVLFEGGHEDLIYVEGWALTPRGMPIEHAWLKTETGTILDPTLCEDDDQGTRYFAALELTRYDVRLCGGLPASLWDPERRRFQMSLQGAWKDAYLAASDAAGFPRPPGMEKTNEETLSSAPLL